MVEPISIIGLTISLGHIVKSIYGICAAFPGIDDHMKEICLQLLTMRDILGRISSAIQFEPLADSQKPVGKFRSREFDEMMASTSRLILDLQAQLTPLAKGKWTQAAKQRISWVFETKKIDEFSAVIAKRIDLLGIILNSENTVLTQRLYTEVRNLSLRNTFELRKDLMKWLGAPDYYSQHAIYLDARQPGTGSWFTNGPLRSWLGEHTRSKEVLWLQDKSGSGKSYLAAHAIESTMTANDNTTPSQLTVLFFYCSSGDISMQTTGSVMGSFIQQMCESRPELWSRVHLESQKASNQAGDFHQSATIDQLERLFQELTSSFQQLCVFLDALNESHEPDALLLALIKAAQEHPSMKLCIFSTPDLSRQRCTPLKVKQIQIDVTQQKSDFRLFIENSLQHNRSLRMLDDELKTKITETLLREADGSFKWVEAVLESLAGHDNISDVERALDYLPPTLEKYYRDTLCKVAPRDRVRVRRLLRWLTVQIRPLTIKELSEAVVLDTGSISPTLDDKQRLLPGSIERYLKAAGSSLVQYDYEAQTVQLAHSSARDFLTSISWQRDKDLTDLYVGHAQEAAESILRACVWYLLQEAFQSGASGAKVSPRESWPLFDYCAHAWPVYFQNLSEASHGLSEIGISLTTRFINSYTMPNGGNYGYWLQKYAPSYVPQVEQTWKMLSPLHLAAGRGWIGLVRFILKRDKKDINVIAGSNRWTPLLRACLYNQEEVVRYLLQNGADPTPSKDFESRIAPILTRMSQPIQKLLTDAMSVKKALPSLIPSPLGGRRIVTPDLSPGKTASPKGASNNHNSDKNPRADGEQCAQQ